MKLYLLLDEHRYVSHLSDVPKELEYEQHEIPTDQAGLMAVLNELLSVVHNKPDKAVEVPAVSTLEETEPVELPDYESSSLRMMSKIDSPGIPVDRVVDIISKSKGYALRRYSGAVAVRFEELSK